MPRTRSTGMKAKRHEMIDTKTEDLLASPLHEDTNTGTSRSRRWPILLVLLLLVLGVLLGSQGYIVAATVNGKPIFWWDLNRTLQTRFGQQTLESLISEKLIADAAKAQGVNVSGSDVEAKMNELVASLGPNVKLEDLLKYQGMTKSDFENQIRLQLTVEKILGKDVTVTEADIDGFIKENRKTMTATDEASLRKEAKDSLFSQRVSEKIQPWFMELKDKAKIVRLVK